MWVYTRITPHIDLHCLYHQGFNQEDLEEEKAEAEMKETADDSDSDDNIKRGKQ